MALLPTSVQLGVEVLMTNGTRTTDVTYSTSDASVATVDSQGLVRAGAVGGTATITITTKALTFGDQAAEKTVTVTVKAVGDVDLTVE